MKEHHHISKERIIEFYQKSIKKKQNLESFKTISEMKKIEHLCDEEHQVYIYLSENPKKKQRVKI